MAPRPVVEMIGQHFGRLVVLERIYDGSRILRYLARCDCGKEIAAFGTNLRRGNTKSCGCLMRELAARSHTKHGDTRHNGITTPEYRSWWAMISRCENPNVIGFQNYGGRGICICERWRQSYSAFLEDMGRKPTRQHTLDRIQNDDGYFPSNCRWATKSEQAFNRRRTKRGPYKKRKAIGSSLSAG